MQELATTLDGRADDPQPQGLATTDDALRECVWTIEDHPANPLADAEQNSHAWQVSVYITTAAALAATGHDPPLRKWFANDASLGQTVQLLGYEASYRASGKTCELEVLTSTAALHLELQGVDNEAALAKLAELAVGRVNSTAP
jgi:hypothetical protein